MKFDQLWQKATQENNRGYWILFGLFLLALLLRVWGLEFGLPNDSRPDEEPLVEAALYGMATPLMTQGTPFSHPVNFYHPAMWPSLLSWLYIGNYFVEGYANWQQYMFEFQNDPTRFYYLARLLSAFVGALCVPAMFLLGQTFRGKTTAWVCAVLTAVSYMMVRNSHFGVMDMLLVLLVIVSMWRILVYFHARTFLNGAWMAIAIGLAVSTKYVAVLMLIPMTLAIIFGPKRSVDSSGSEGVEKIEDDPRIPYVIVLMVFLSVNPWVMFDFERFTEHLSFDFKQMKSGNPVSEFGATYYLRYVFQYSLGILFSTAFIVGAVNGFKRWLFNDLSNNNLVINKDGIILLTMCFGFTLLAVQTTVMSRYALPLMPWIILYGALGIEKISLWCFKKTEKIKNFQNKITELRAIVLISTAVALPILLTTIQFNQLISQQDTRTLTRNWLLEHAQPRSPVATGGRVGRIKLPASYGQLVMDTAWNVFKPMPKSAKDIETLEINPQTRLITSYIDIEQLRQWGIQYVILYRSMFLFSNPPWELPHYMRSVKLVHHITPLKNNKEKNKKVENKNVSVQNQLYEPMDAFFLPFKQFGDFERPGPEIFIFDITQSATQEQLTMFEEKRK